MAALTQGRRTARRGGEIVSHPLAAGAVVYAGGMVCLTAAGYLTPGAADPTLRFVGVAGDTVNNAGASAGAARCDVERRGAWHFANHATDTVGRQHIGQRAYIADDQTLAATAGLVEGAATRPAAGTIIDVDANGVWIEL